MKDLAKGKEVVIIGSGIGGLSAGILLAGRNYRVTIVEKNPLPGGLMRSYRREGINCPVGVHYVGALGEDEPMGEMFRALGIDVNEIFVRMGQGGVIDRYIFDDFTFDLPANIDAYETNLRNAFPADAKAIDIYMKNLREISHRMLDSAFLLNQGNPFQNIDFYEPLGDFLDNLDISVGLRAVISVPCQLFGVPPSQCPMILHHMVLSCYLFSAWRLKESGAQMTDVLVRRFYQLGGKLILNSSVEKILLDQKKAAGIRLKSGREIPADYIIADIHPKILLTMLVNDALRPSLRQRILDLTETDGVISVQISMDAAAHPEIAHNIYRLHADDKGEIKDGVFYQIRKVNDKVSLLSIITKSLYREWRMWEQTTSKMRTKDYEEKKYSLAKELLQKAEILFGPLKNAHIIDVFTPLTIRDYVNCPEGSCYGVMRSSGQLLKVASINNLPVESLYLTGQNALAPGVMGSILGAINVTRQITGENSFNQILNGKLKRVDE